MREPRQETLHPRNRHRGGLDFKLLTAARPELSRFVSVNQWGNESINFADPAAVKSLNAALLKQFYGVANWDIPPGYLCPSVPGRADYLHYLADLLAIDGVIPRGPEVRALDIGVGANCVYPLIGTHEYGWSFAGTDTDPRAIASAKRIVESNPGLRIELRLQPSPAKMLLLKPGETFAVTLCNPPFHDSPEAAAEGTRRKWKNLGETNRAVLNFGGGGAELWYPGGESRFIRKLIDESARAPDRSRWFTTLVSKSSNLPAIKRALAAVRVRESRFIEMKQGQKTSRIAAWRF
ncbi:MAG TPA: 23S rRNA (adenine(1618)-N(6))-methyltransferase RlmF [Myxococcales bacterium]|nr:23S rRNA (adenine(1618)-N(6))-methyltransferase RlmF [Myxococcales bacterium]